MLACHRSARDAIIVCYTMEYTKVALGSQKLFCTPGTSTLSWRMSLFGVRTGSSCEGISVF